MNIVVTNPATPVMQLDQFGSGSTTKDLVRRAADGMSNETIDALGRLDLSNVRPSQLRGIVVRLKEEGKMTEDMASVILLERSRGTDKLSSDTPFNLVDRLDRLHRIVQSLSPTDPAFSFRSVYEETLYCARGMQRLASVLKTGELFHVIA
ncbi:hypothetical protein KPL74_16140 [Bacillus sp. NP157]|nr:hypothetical protein KPL74_16140 [Bacillus sp. NP157]